MECLNHGQEATAFPVDSLKILHGLLIDPSQSDAYEYVASFDLRSIHNTHLKETLQSAWTLMKHPARNSYDHIKHKPWQVSTLRRSWRGPRSPSGPGSWVVLQLKEEHVLTGNPSTHGFRLGNADCHHGFRRGIASQFTISTSWVHHGGFPTCALIWSKSRVVSRRSRSSSLSLRWETFNLPVGRLCNILRARATSGADGVAIFTSCFEISNVRFLPQSSAVFIFICAAHATMFWGFWFLVASPVIYLMTFQLFYPTIPNYPHYILSIILPWKKHVMIPPFYPSKSSSMLVSGARIGVLGLAGTGDLSGVTLVLVLDLGVVNQPLK